MMFGSLSERQDVLTTSGQTAGNMTPAETAAVSLRKSLRESLVMENYLALPWLATAAAALAISSGSPR